MKTDSIFLLDRLNEVIDILLHFGMDLNDAMNNASSDRYTYSRIFFPAFSYVFSQIE